LCEIPKRFLYRAIINPAAPTAKAHWALPLAACIMAPPVAAALALADVILEALGKAV